ncbi:uncharacterized protein LOC143291652 [Babylonia areolata]|uniref:uncharacterized protein LOC143291652 n=1 Tax=Babylonia areolata TaxID=304850 RepID=UPI003FD38A53
MALTTTFRHHLFTSALLLLLLALSASSTQSQDHNDAGSAPARLSAASSLAHLLRGRRSAELQAPPHYYAASRLGAGFFGSAPSKRDDGYWIWMPAHGYMSVPRDEVASSSGDKDSMGNLLRYGRK